MRYFTNQHIRCYQLVIYRAWWWKDCYFSAFQLRAFYLFRTEFFNLTFFAVGFSSGADIASVQQQPMVGIGDIRFRDMLYQFLFHLIGRVGALAHQPEPVGHAIHMCIHRQCRFAESHTLDHVCRLPSHARQVE